MTTLSSTSRIANPTGYLVGLVGVDSFHIVVFAYQFAIPTWSAVCLPVILAIIALKVGVGPVLSCVAYILMLMSLLPLASRLQKKLLVRHRTAHFCYDNELA